MTKPDERPTPRCIATGNPCGTDTVLVGRECSANNGVCIRRLERERDEARAKLDATCSPESFNALVRQRTELIAERDALRAALRELLDDIGPVNHDLCDPPCIHRRARALLGEAT